MPTTTTPSKFDYLTGTITSLGATIDSSPYLHTVRDTCLTGPVRIGGTLYAQGLLIVGYDYNDDSTPPGNRQLRCKAFNVANGTEIGSLAYAVTSPNVGGQIFCVQPLPGGLAGYVVAYKTGDDDIFLMSMRPNLSQVEAVVEGVIGVSCMAFVSRSNGPVLAVGFLQSQTPSAPEQLHFYSIDLNRTETGTGDAITKIGAHEFDETSYSGWEHYPDTICAIAPMPLLPGITPGNTMAMLLGENNGWGVGFARLMLFSLDRDEILLSHDETEMYANSMVVDQLGNIYVAGNGDIVNAGADKMICKYRVTASGFELVASVTFHALPGEVGKYHLTSAQAAYAVPSIAWDGSRLIVEDWGTTAGVGTGNVSRILVYDANLNYIGQQALSTTGSSSPPRFIGLKNGQSWKARHY